MASTKNKKHLLALEKPLLLKQDFSELVDENRNLKRELSKKKSEYQTLLSQLSRLEELAAIGTNGATIAHELNNPLTIICAEADEILDLLRDPEISHSLIEQSARNIKNSSLRIHNIISHFQASRDEKTDKRWHKHNLNEIIKKSIELIAPQLKQKGIRVITDLQKDLPAIWGEKSKLESILQNLLINAMDAFVNVNGNRDKQIFISTRFKNRFVNIVVKDTGSGIPDELRTKIFTPFFTTKERHGTGLGLAIVARYVKEHQGQIDFNSATDSGTEFILRFPLEKKKWKNQQKF